MLSDCSFALLNCCLTALTTMPDCCRYNGLGSCRRCSCVKSGRVGVNFLPMRKGHYENIRTLSRHSPALRVTLVPSLPPDSRWSSLTSSPCVLSSPTCELITLPSLSRDSALLYMDRLLRECRTRLTVHSLPINLFLLSIYSPGG